MDVAASEFRKGEKYDLDFKNPDTNEKDWISSKQLMEMYLDFIKVIKKFNHLNFLKFSRFTK